MGKLLHHPCLSVCQEWLQPCLLSFTFYRNQFKEHETEGGNRNKKSSLAVEISHAEIWPLKIGMGGVLYRPLPFVPRSAFQRSWRVFLCLAGIFSNKHDASWSLLTLPDQSQNQSLWKTVEIKKKSVRASPLLSIVSHFLIGWFRWNMRWAVTGNRLLS